jgi:hypothetical protein
MRTRHRIPMIFSLSMMDVFCCTLGCVILLWLVNQREALLRAKSASEVTSQLTVTRSDLVAAARERDALQDQLAAARRNLDQSREQADAARRDLAAARGRADELDKELAEAKAAAADTADRLAKKSQVAQALAQQMANTLQRVTELETLLRSRTAEQETAAGRAADLSDQLARAEERLAKLKAAADTDAAKSGERLTAAEARLKSLESDLHERDRDLDSARRTLAESQAEKHDLSGKLAKAQGVADARFEGIALTGKRVVFLVDMSGSMELVDENTPAPLKWSGLRETLLKIMRSLPELEKVQVILFSDKVTYLLGNEGRWLDYDAAATPARVATAMAAVKPKGNTNMYDALDTTFRFRTQGLDTVYFLSDGLPNVGAGLTQREAQTLNETARGEILSKHIRLTLKKQWNVPQPGAARVRINTVGFFYESPDVGAFLWALARENDGSFVGMSKP